MAISKDISSWCGLGLGTTVAESSAVEHAWTAPVEHAGTGGRHDRSRVNAGGDRGNGYCGSGKKGCTGGEER